VVFPDLKRSGNADNSESSNIHIRYIIDNQC